MRRLSITAIAALAALFAGCGGGNGTVGGGVSGGGASSSGTVVVAGGSQFATFLQTTSGVVPAQGSPLTTVGSAAACASDPSNAIAVVAYNNNTIQSFSVDANGTPTAVTTSVLSGQSNAIAEVGARLIYVPETNAGFTQMAVFALGSGGTLQGLPTQFPNFPVVDAIGHPNGQILIASETPTGLQAFSVDPISGQLTPLSQVLSGVGGSGTHSMAFMQNGAFLLVAEGTSPNFPLDVVTLNTTTGALTQLGPAVDVPNGALFLAPHQNGRFVYAVGQNAVTLLTVDANGIVTVGTTTQMPSGATPTAATVDKSGTTLFVTTSNGSLLGFGIDANTGTLTAAPVTTTSLNFNSVCVFPK